MGTGSLKRIAALTALAMTSVMFSGAVNVGALVSVPTTTTTTTLPATGQVTVPSTTVTVPETVVTPETTVTTPTVTTPKAPAPTPSVSAPKTPTAPKLPTDGGGGGSGGGSVAGDSPTTTVQKITDSVTSGGTSGTTTKVTDGTTKVTSGAGSVAGGGAAGGGGGTAAEQGLAALGALGGPPAAGGGTGGPGAGIFGGPAGGALPARLSAEKAAQLRFALDQLEGCLGAIAPIDRQVLGMRAGLGGGPPLSRTQVAARLGVSTRQVRLSERRGISGLRAAAEQTGCAGAVGGPFAVGSIGALPLTTLALASAGGSIDAAGAAGSAFVPARQAEAGAGSPQFGLDGAGGSGPAWLVVLITVLFSVAIAGLMRELRSSVAPRI